MNHIAMLVESDFAGRDTSFVGQIMPNILGAAACSIFLHKVVSPQL